MLREFVWRAADTATKSWIRFPNWAGGYRATDGRRQAQKHRGHEMFD
jgi:hypothetical protein